MMGRRRAFVSISLILLFLFIIIMDLIPTDASGIAAPLAPLDPDVWVEVDHEESNINVEPEVSEGFMVTAWVHCDVPPDLPPGEFVTVKVDVIKTFVKVDIMQTDVFPDLFIFDFDRKTDVAQMNFPFTELSGVSVEWEIKVIFQPKWSIKRPARNGVGSSNETIFHILPYGSVSVKYVDRLKFDVGKMEYVEMIVENNGNCEAKISIQIEQEEGLEFLHPDLLFIIPERSFDVYQLGIKQPSGGGKEGKIHVRAVSSVPGRSSTYEFDIEYETKGKLEVFLTNPLVSIASLVLMAVFISSVVLLVRRRQRKRELLLN